MKQLDIDMSQPVNINTYMTLTQATFNPMTLGAITFEIWIIYW